jgi:prolyl 4-hydroxylase
MQSHTVLHGRPFPLKGRFLANLFIHFIPVDHAEMNAIDKLSRPTAALSHLNRKYGGHESENHDFDDIVRTEREEQLEKIRSMQAKRLSEPLELKNVDLNPDFLASILDEEHDEISDADPPQPHAEEELELSRSGEDLKPNGHFTLRQTDLHIAAAHGNVERVKQLLESPYCDINAKDENGWEPLHEAVHGGHLEVTKLLLARGANLSSRTNGGGTPMWWARGTFAPDHPMVAFLESINAPMEGVQATHEAEGEEEEEDSYSSYE